MAIERSETTQSGQSDAGRPDFLLPGIRCALEMALAGGLVLLVGLPAANLVYVGVVVTLALVVMVVVLFWALNRQMAQWVEATDNSGDRRNDEQLSAGPILGENQRSD
jgi:membrane protein implicated in regulation of membrane protease activity